MVDQENKMNFCEGICFCYALQVVMRLEFEEREEVVHNIIWTIVIWVSVLISSRLTLWTIDIGVRFEKIWTTSGGGGKVKEQTKGAKRVVHVKDLNSLKELQKAQEMELLLQHLLKQDIGVSD